jgi:molybdopterin synthase catalytic subunit
LLANTLVSVNKNYSFDADKIPDGAEVALFPPVSGGSFPTILEIVQEPLDHDDLLKQITLPTTGAICLFSGIVRGETRRGDAHQTQALEYEAYIPMAKAKMAQVADEIRQRWPSIEGIVVVQRIGLLEAGTPTVVIACSAAHRDTGVFEAARYGIDRLKEIVPIWKKEIGPGGEVWIEGDYHPHRGD